MVFGSNDDLMDFVGYRNMILEEKIEICLEAIRRGETEVTFDREDLTDAEIDYISREVRKRMLS